MEIGDEKYILVRAVVRAPTPDGGPRADSEVRERDLVLRLHHHDHRQDPLAPLQGSREKSCAQNCASAALETRRSAHERHLF